MKATITLLPGDGIGPEVTAQAARVLEVIASTFRHRFNFVTAPIGGAAVDETGEALPAETLAACERSDAVFLGAVGGDRWSSLQPHQRPESALLRLRQHLDVFANVRPIRVLPELAHRSPIRLDPLDDVDIVFVRELTGGLYYGQRQRTPDAASDACEYTVHQIERVTRTAFALAEHRRGLVTSVDKANVLETSRLWRDTVTRIAREEYPGIEVEHLLVDAAAMHLITRPASFDVVLTENMFGDILTDQASVLAGSLGMIPSASLSDNGPGLFEPIHGSAPDLAGTGRANPIGAILSAAMLLRHGLGLDLEADAVERAVTETIRAGVMTPDLSPNGHARSTEAVTTAIHERLVRHEFAVP